MVAIGARWHGRAANARTIGCVCVSRPANGAWSIYAENVFPGGRTQPWGGTIWLVLDDAHAVKQGTVSVDLSAALSAVGMWRSTIADPSGSPRSIVSASFDGTRPYVGGGGATINGTSCYGNVSALDPATGAFIWRSCQDFMTAGFTVVPGILTEGTGAGGRIMFLNTANGATNQLQREEHGAGGGDGPQRDHVRAARQREPDRGRPVDRSFPAARAGRLVAPSQTT
jgi:hypothetical protein